jgi:hypothetical protein
VVAITNWVNDADVLGVSVARTSSTPDVFHNVATIVRVPPGDENVDGDMIPDVGNGAGFWILPANPEYVPAVNAPP